MTGISVRVTTCRRTPIPDQVERLVETLTRGSDSVVVISNDEKARPLDTSRA